MRKLIYVLILLLFMLVTWYKAKIITDKKNHDVISIESEWLKHGKPVSVVNVQKERFVSYLTLSGRVKYNNEILVEANAYLKNKLKVGQSFFVKIEGEKVFGHVEYIDNYEDVLTGLYVVKLVANENLMTKNNELVEVKVAVNVKDYVFQIPLSGVVVDGNDTYCWVVDGDIAKKRHIVTGDKSEDMIIIKEGLKTGDCVCVEGVQALQENDKVRIFVEGKI